MAKVIRKTVFGRYEYCVKLAFSDIFNKNISDSLPPTYIPSRLEERRSKAKSER